MAKKALVAYFSASGVTAALAKRLADAIGADLHEIQPEVPYTKEDLDWTNKNSRSSVEMNDKSFCPQVANRVENIDDYDIIYIGFPIWWYVAPTIINTFLEQYNLTGKEIIPFATSGSSGMGRTNEELKVSCNGAVLKEGRRFAANTDAAELKAWADKDLSR
ncbi:MAG: NAD(P)H-dependent oxidoreductase [Clostridiales bacterium]|nr:NAD(P)H-dependent oxidoreductase [Clostridiales bacterium]